MAAPSVPRVVVGLGADVDVVAPPEEPVDEGGSASVDDEPHAVSANDEATATAMVNASKLRALVCVPGVDAIGSFN